jgi:hypothetical protein
MQRAAAILLLALLIFDFGVDLWKGELRDSDSGRSTISLLKDAGVSKPSCFKDLRHECLCCCSHVEQQQRVVFTVSFESSPGYLAVESSPPEFVRAPIFHPPPPVS